MRNLGWDRTKGHFSGYQLPSTCPLLQLVPPGHVEEKAPDFNTKSLAWRLGLINTPIPVLDLEVLLSIPRGDPASSLVPCTPPPWIKYNLDLGLLGTEVSGAALGDG